MTNHDRYQTELNAGRHVAAAQLALHFAGGCGSRAGAWRWANLALGDLPDFAAVVASALDNGTGWPDLDAASAIFTPQAVPYLTTPPQNPTPPPHQEDTFEIIDDRFTTLRALAPSREPPPAWQPTGPAPWPDQVNEQLSRHGAGLEDHERRLAALEAITRELENTPPRPQRSHRSGVL